MGCVVVVVLLLSVVPGDAPVQSALWMSWMESEELRWRRGERGFSTVRVRMVFRSSLEGFVSGMCAGGKGGGEGGGGEEGGEERLEKLPRAVVDAGAAVYPVAYCGEAFGRMESRDLGGAWLVLVFFFLLVGCRSGCHVPQCIMMVVVLVLVLVLVLGLGGGRGRGRGESRDGGGGGGRCGGGGGGGGCWGGGILRGRASE